MVENDVGHLINTFERARGYLPGDPYLDLSHQLPLASGHQHTVGLDGNLGAILFRDEAGGFLDTDWIAASTKIHPLVQERAAVTGDTFVYLDGPNKNRKVQWLKPGAKPVGLNAVIGPTQQRSKNDTEIVLLNAMHLALAYMGNPRGHVVLLTDRIPCASCTEVIKRFVRQTPNVSLSVAFLADYVNSSLQRSHVEYLAQISAAPAAHVPLFRVDKVMSDYYEIAEIGTDEQLHECRVENFGPRTGLWCGQNPDGSPRFAPWDVRHYVALRRMLRYPIAVRK